MKTEKLYYNDPYIRTFKTRSIEQQKDEQGRLYVVLEETAFYPTGGGQPSDTGTLNEVPVYEVEEIEGEIRHYVKEPLDGQRDVVGEIDWERRFDHMQQHAGQHILTAAFEERFGYKTESFHLGQEFCTIDLDTSNLTAEEVLEVEQLANSIILENRPIESKWVTADELAVYPLRKALSVSENIRLVIIPDVDYNGCGGTHPSSTGQVCSLKVLDCDRQKKQTRVTFVCGNRVLRQLHEKHAVIQRVTALLSVPQEGVVDAVSRVLQQTKELEKTVSVLKRELLEVEATTLIQQATLHNEKKVVKAFFQQRPISDVQTLAKVITEKTSDIVVLFINETEDKLQTICASGSESSANMNTLVKAVLPKINGKGGGNAIFAQGGGEKTLSPAALMDELLQEI